MKKEAGFLVIAAVVMIVIFSLLSAALVKMSISGAGSATVTQAANKAYGLANTAIENAAYQMIQPTPLTCDGTYTTVTLSPGEYRYKCTPNDAYTQASGATGTGTTITVADTAAFSPVGALAIDFEVIYYNAKNATQFLNVKRGQEGSANVSHSNNTWVYQTQYNLTGEGGAPTLSGARGTRVITQVAKFTNYIAVGDTPYFYRNIYGGGWTSTSYSGTTAIVNGIACLSATDCHAVGSGGRFYRYNGTSWTTNGRIGNDNITAISCVNANFCRAVGARSNPNNYMFYKWNGSSWSADTKDGSVTNRNLNAVACTSTTNCHAAGQASRFFRYNGTTWSEIVNASPNTTIYGMACTSSSNCWAVGASGRAFRYNGTTWTNTTSIGGVNLRGLYCVSANNCHAAGNNAVFWRYNGTSWTSQSLNGVPVNGAAIQGIACATSSDCKAGGNNGRFYSYNGTSWAIMQDTGGSTIWGIAATPPASIGNVNRNVDPL